MTGKILAVDPGDKRIGLALSDPSQTIARPLMVIKHTSRVMDAAKIIIIANQNEVEKIIIGQNIDTNGEASPQGRKASRLAQIIQSQTEIKVEMWDESGSTQRVKKTSIEMRESRKTREKKRDDLAAMMILQDYLNSCLHRKILP